MQHSGRSVRVLVSDGPIAADWTSRRATIGRALPHDGIRKCEVARLAAAPTLSPDLPCASSRLSYPLLSIVGAALAHANQRRNGRQCPEMCVRRFRVRIFQFVALLDCSTRATFRNAPKRISTVDSCCCHVSYTTASLTPLLPALNSSKRT